MRVHRRLSAWKLSTCDPSSSSDMSTACLLIFLIYREGSPLYSLTSQIHVHIIGGRACRVFLLIFLLFFSILSLIGKIYPFLLSPHSKTTLRIFTNRGRFWPCSEKAPEAVVLACVIISAVPVKVWFALRIPFCCGFIAVWPICIFRVVCSGASYKSSFSSFFSFFSLFLRSLSAWSLLVSSAAINGYKLSPFLKSWDTSEFNPICVYSCLCAVSITELLGKARGVKKFDFTRVIWL